jgi:hypothetical protein
MKKGLALTAALLVALTLSATASFARGGKSGSDHTTKVRDLSLELVGQVTNSPPGVSPATSIQYGYLAYVGGLATFSGDTQNETTALFSFFVQSTTTRVIVNGPLRIVTREATMTVYLDPSPNGNFANPDTFQDGTPVLVAGVRQQVIVNTITGSFTTLNSNTITSTSSFPAANGQVQLGEVGQQFKTIIHGQVNSPAPSAYIAGYTLNSSDRPNHGGDD